MPRPLTFLLLAAGLVAGCGEHPPAGGAPAATPPAARPAAPAADAAARADRLRADAARLPGVAGRSDRDGIESSWRAAFDGSELRLIEETVTGAAGQSFRNRYYYEGGALFYYTGEQPAAAGGGAVGPDARSPVIVEFRGQLTPRAVRIEHYGEAPLEPAAIAAIRRRAGELASSARDERAAKSPS